MGGSGSGHVWGGNADGSCATSPCPRTTASSTCAARTCPRSAQTVLSHTGPEHSLGARWAPGTSLPLTPHPHPFGPAESPRPPPLLGRLNFGARHPRTPPPLTHFTPWGAAGGPEPPSWASTMGCPRQHHTRSPHSPCHKIHVKDDSAQRLRHLLRFPHRGGVTPLAAGGSHARHSQRSPKALTEPRRQATSALPAPASGDRAPRPPHAKRRSPPVALLCPPPDGPAAPAPATGGRDEVVHAAGRPFVTLLLLSPAGASPPTPAPRSGHGSCRPSPRHPAPAPCPQRAGGARLAGDAAAAARGVAEASRSPGLVPYSATTRLNPVLWQELLATQLWASRCVLPFLGGAGFIWLPGRASHSGEKF